MKVVTDTSPLISLKAIGHLNILNELFDKVVVPEGVRDELQAEGKKFFLEEWIEVIELKEQDAKKILSLGLGIGESEAITLFFEGEYDLIILDDKNARKIARNLGLKVIGTVGILLLAKKKKLIKSLKEEIEALEEKTNFRISDGIKK